MWTLLTLLMAAAYCGVRAVFDLRQRRYGWAAAGALACVAILLTPIQTHAVAYRIF